MWRRPSPSNLGRAGFRDRNSRQGARPPARAARTGRVQGAAGLSGPSPQVCGGCALPSLSSSRRVAAAPRARRRGTFLVAVEAWGTVSEIGGQMQNKHRSPGFRLVSRLSAALYRYRSTVPPASPRPLVPVEVGGEGAPRPRPGQGCPRPDPLAPRFSGSRAHLPEGLIKHRSVDLRVSVSGLRRDPGLGESNKLPADAAAPGLGASPGPRPPAGASRCPRGTPGDQPVCWTRTFGRIGAPRKWEVSSADRFLGTESGTRAVTCLFKPATHRKQTCSPRQALDYQTWLTFWKEGERLKFRHS